MIRPAEIQLPALGDPANDQEGIVGLHDELHSLAASLGYGERAAREAALALAAALLAHFGLASSRCDGRMERHAAAGLERIRPQSPSSSGETLAIVYESAIGGAARRDQGAVFTPPDVVRFIVREALAARVAAELDLSLSRSREVLWEGAAVSLAAGPREHLGALLAGLTIVDPAVGAGAFLIGAATELASVARSLAEAGVAGLDSVTHEGGALQRCFGFDVDADSAEIANAVLALAVGGPSAGLQPVRVIVRDALLEGFEHPAAEGGWDIVVMNPPYIGQKFLTTRLGDGAGSALLARDGFAGDLLAHFIVRALDGVRERGAVSAIVSDTMLTMESSTRLRRILVDDVRLRSIAWSRPFETVAVHAGILTATREVAGEADCVDCIAEDDGSRLLSADRVAVPLVEFRALPNKALYRPSDAARTIVERWNAIPELEGLWSAASGRQRSADGRGLLSSALEPGDWTLLGAVTRSGQGLATGDDRRFVGFVAGSNEARKALQRQHRIAAALRADSSAIFAWSAIRENMSQGSSLEGALLALLGLRDEGKVGDIPERKPFRVVPVDQVRSTRLSARERLHGIQEGPAWVSYETSDRSSARGGAAWVRQNPVVLDWSVESVAILRHRRAHGPRKPVMRNEDLWFAGGVTHNRVASYLRARLLPAGAIFSSESPVYLSTVEWLDQLSLLALLNAPVVEFAIKTFLATRNHFEVGHLRRLPVPVLDPDQQSVLREIARNAVRACEADDIAELSVIDRSLDQFTRDLYGITRSLELPVRR